MRKIYFNILKLIKVLRIKVDKFSLNNLFAKNFFINNIVKITRKSFVKKIFIVTLIINYFKNIDINYNFRK